MAAAAQRVSSAARCFETAFILLEQHFLQVQFDDHDMNLIQPAAAI